MKFSMFGIFGDNKSETEEINIVKDGQYYLVQKKKGDEVSYLCFMIPILHGFHYGTKHALKTDTAEQSEMNYKNYLVFLDKINNPKPPVVIKKLK